MPMDIKSGSGYPAAALSNFSPHPFILDGVNISSMEGFLQSLKFKNPDMQVEVCKLVGLAAKRKGKPKRWQTRQLLWWRGVAIPRDSVQYQNLLDRAYQAMYDQSESFRKALAATGSSTIEHSIGRSNHRETVLTRSEFCSRLLKLRDTKQL
jgi:predicted NAD-dependent protein-ADP-ribosyltransferase YbiA (DUF1768 family)